MNSSKIQDVVVTLLPQFQLQRLLNKNGKAGRMSSRVIKLAKLSPEEAYMLIYDLVRKSDMYELITLIQSIFNIEQQMKLKYG
jgi:hypothetical protein